MDANSHDFAGGRWTLVIDGDGGDWPPNPGTTFAPPWGWDLSGLDGTFTLTSATGADTLTADVGMTLWVDAPDENYEQAVGGRWSLVGPVVSGRWGGRTIVGGSLIGNALFDVSEVYDQRPQGPGKLVTQTVEGELDLGEPYATPEPGLPLMMGLGLLGLGGVAARRSARRRSNSRLGA